MRTTAIEWREVAEGRESLPGKDLYVDGARRGVVVRTPYGTAIGYADPDGAGMQRLGHYYNESDATAGVLCACGLKEKLQ